MTIFSEDSKCVKCGSDMIITEFKTTYEKEGKKEMLVRKCSRCGYNWIEEPLDSQQAKS